MANANNPHGLRPLGRTLAGGFPTVDSYPKAAADAQALYMYDAVSRAGGFITGTSTPGTTLFTGVNLNPGFASLQTDHLVIISPDAMFEAQDDNSGGAGFAAADMGKNANLNLSAPSVTAPGAGYTGISGHQIARSTKAATNTLDVHLHRLYLASDNAFGANARIEISFNKHALASASVAGA